MKIKKIKTKNKMKFFKINKNKYRKKQFMYSVIIFIINFIYNYYSF